MGPLTWAAALGGKYLLDKFNNWLSSQSDPVCGVPGCGCVSTHHTRCCGVDLCRTHLDEFVDLCQQTGRCPIGTCRKRV